MNSLQERIHQTSLQTFGENLSNVEIVNIVWNVEVDKIIADGKLFLLL